MKRLVIFDLDGTLLNSIGDLMTACNVALHSFHYPIHDEEAYKTYVGNGIYKLVERSMPKAYRQEEQILAVKAVFDTYYAAHCEDKTKPYEGILDLLTVLQEKGIICGVVTNKAQVYAEALVKQFFGTRIHLVLGQREGIPTKPNPYAVLEMIDYFKVATADCLYVGDSNVDIETAKAAGVESVGVLWGFRSKAELSAAGATYLAAHVSDLKEIILEDK